MAYIATSGGQTVRLEVTPDGEGFRVRLNDREVPVDVRQAGETLYSLLIQGRSYEVDLLEVDGALMVLVEGQPFRVEIRREHARLAPAAPRRAAATPSGQVVTAPMPGKVVRVLVRPGDCVRAGDGVVVVEAMKMENELAAAGAGVVREVRVEEGRAVNGGDVLVVIE